MTKLLYPALAGRTRIRKKKLLRAFRIADCVAMVES
jgi:hypothetical protein